MALTKQQKVEVVEEVSKLLEGSKMTVAAKYSGTSVKAMQELRKSGKVNGTVVRVVKNRLLIKALKDSPKYKETDTSKLNDMLLYAFNSEDEVAPAQTLANFAKTNPTIEFVGAFSAEGQFIPAEEVRSLAALPTKEQLKAILVGTIKAPLNGLSAVLSNNVRGLFNVLNARRQQIN